MYYCFYKFDSNFHLLFNYINPFRLLIYTPFMKKRCKSVNVDLQKEIDYAFSRNGGISLYRAGFFLFMFTMAFSVSISHFVEGLIFFQLKDYFLFYIIVGAISYLFNYNLIHKKNKYIPYFNMFEKYNKSKKIKLALLCIAVLVCISLLLYYSFVFYGYRMNNR